MIALTVLAGLLSACGASRLARAPAAPTDLTGQWVLDRAASDDAARIIAAALPKPRPARGGEVAGSGAAGGAPGRPPPGDGDGRRERVDVAETPAQVERERGRGRALGFLRDYVAPAEYLELATAAAGVLTIAQGDRRRTHELGTEFPPSVTDRYGSRVVRAGWEGRVLVVTSDGGQQFRLRETFRAGPEPDTLAYRVELRAQGLKDVDIDALYRRTSGRPAARAPSEGPPAPLR